jgi:membrane protein
MASDHVVRRGGWAVLRAAAEDFQRHKAARLAGALAFYTLFSLAPFLLLVLHLVARLVGSAAARAELHRQVVTVSGAEAGDSLARLLDPAQGPVRAGALPAILATIVLVWGATSLFTALQDAMDTVWDVRPRPGLGWRRILSVRVRSFVMVLVVGVLVLAAIVATVLLGSLLRLLHLAGSETAWRLAGAGLSLVLSTALFAVLFAVLPDARVRLRDALPGAFLTGLLFAAGHVVLSLYLSHSHVGSMYGAAGSLVALLVWIYWSYQLLLAGAELTRCWLLWRGKAPEPEGHAERVPC